MRKLTKKYQIVHIGVQMVNEVNENGMRGETFPAKDADAFETDDWEEAKKYIEENNLVYEGNDYANIDDNS
jgi:hypothetical protein